VDGRAIECCQLHFRPSTPITMLTTKLAGAWEGGSAFSQENKSVMNCFLEHNNLVRKVHFSNKLFKTAQL